MIKTIYLLNRAPEWMPIIDIDSMMVICNIYSDLMLDQLRGLYYTHIYIWRGGKPNDNINNSLRDYYLITWFNCHGAVKLYDSNYKGIVAVWKEPYNLMNIVVNHFNHKIVENGQTRKFTKFKRLYKKDIIKF